MNTLQTSEAKTKKFLATIGPSLRAYHSVGVSFVALVHEGQETILGASVRLNRGPEPLRQREFSTRSLRAAHLYLPGTGEVIPQIIDAITSFCGYLVGNHLLKLLPSSQGDYSAYHDNSSGPTNRDTKSIERLIIRGESKWTLINSAELDVDTELRREGFESLYDLLWEFDLTCSDDTYLEILVGPLPLFSSASQISGQHLRIVADLPLELSKEHFRVSVRSANRSHRGTQRVIPPEKFEWDRAEGHQRAIYKEKVEVGSVLDCQAIYCRTIYDSVRLYDPTTSANSRRMVVEISDPRLEGLSRVLEKVSDRSDRWRNEFESTVAVIFHMLGFETVRIGGARKLTDGPDIYASTPSGELLVVECTTGSFNDEKISKLIARTKQAQKKFDGTILSPRNISPLIVTPQTLEELDSCVELADRSGVILLCGTQLREAFEETRLMRNPDDTLAEWRRAATIRSLSSSLID